MSIPDPAIQTGQHAGQCSASSDADTAPAPVVVPPVVEEAGISKKLFELSKPSSAQNQQPKQAQPASAHKHEATPAAETPAAHTLRAVIVTGLSGSGKSTAMQVFEDLNYFTVDGLPPSMAPEMVRLMERPSMAHFKGIALGLHMRLPAHVAEMRDAVATMNKDGFTPEVIFVEADTPEIMRRYQSTRRPHPLEQDGNGLEASIGIERSRFAPLRAEADMIVNTTKYSIHDLRRIIQKRFRSRQGVMHALRVNVLSFGFKYGMPSEADFVFDLRFLPNPYFVQELRSKSGKEKDVSDYVFATARAREFRAKLLELLFLMLPVMEAEGRYRVTLAFGCTGGRHRSVAMAEAVHQALAQACYPASIEHRHLELG